MNLKKSLSSSVGKKFVMALTGLGLVGFLISHLAANLLILKSDSTSFNSYALGLQKLGPLLLVAELGLAALFLAHIISAINVKITNSAARGTSYKVQKTKGGASLSSPASRNMILTGMIVLGFLILHVWQFRFGPGIDAGYVTDIDSESARDLHKLVLETFQNPLFVGFYSVCMVILGLHLRHGFWSAFQSLGMLNTETRKSLYFLSFVLAVILAGGFLLIPVWIYFDFGQLFQ